MKKLALFVSKYVNGMIVCQYLYHSIITRPLYTTNYPAHFLYRLDDFFPLFNRFNERKNIMNRSVRSLSVHLSHLSILTALPAAAVEAAAEVA